MDGLSRKQKVILVAIGVVLSVIVPIGFAGAESFLSGFFSTSANIHHNASDGPEVIQTKDYNLRSGNPYTDKSYNLSTENNGWINVSTSDPDSSDMVVAIDQIEGDFTETSQITAASGDITLDPSDKTAVTVGGQISSIDFREMGVNDGQVDFRYTASGESTIIVETNATQGTQYGLVDPATEEGLDVAVAGSGGTIEFTEVPSTTGETDVRIEELGILDIREETPPHDLITTATAEVTFYEDEEDSPTIVRRTTNNGQIDLTGLPIDEEFSVSVQTGGYHNRTVIIDDLSQQQNVFMINKNETTVENRFTIEDRTGDFPSDETELRIQKAINRTEFGGSPGGFAWVNVAGDDVGADEAFTTDLIEDDRYRLVVTNDDGDTRVLGAYTAETTGDISLRIGRVVLDPEETPQPAYQVNQTGGDGTPTNIHFEYNDSQTQTQTIWLEIYEYNNESNVLLSNTSFTGPFGTFTHTELVPNDRNETTWAVKFTIDRAGQSNIQSEVVVGPTNPVIPELPTWLVSIVFVGTIWMTAGLFSQLNGDIGALVVAGMGAIFFQIDLVPPQLGAGVLGLALITAGIMFIRERQGGSL